MKIALTILLILFFNLVLQNDCGCNGNCGNGGGGSQCQTPFYPPYDVRAGFQPVQGGVVVAWNDRGYKDGYQVFRCEVNCAYQVQDGTYRANLNNFHPITNNKFAGTFYTDKNVARGGTYFYAVQNRYQSCGFNWSSNYAVTTVQ